MSILVAKGVGRKISRGGRGPTEKRPKNSPIKPLSTVFVPCMKIQGEGIRPLLLTPMLVATNYNS